MENNTKQDFIFITQGMIDKMKEGSLKNTIDGHIDYYKKNIGKDHVHTMNGDVLVWNDEQIDYYIGLTNNWSEEGTEILNGGNLKIYIAFCDINNLFHSQPKHCLYAIRDFMCEFLNASGLVNLDSKVYCESNELEQYINQKYLN